MIVKLTAKNQRQLFDDDMRRFRANLSLHYSIGQHVSLLIDRMDALEAAQGMSPGTAETGTGSGPKDGQPGPATQDAPK